MPFSDTLDVRLTDTCLRDGSHAVRHQLTTAQVRDIVAALDGAGVPVLEVAHGDGLGGSSFTYGFSGTPETELIQAAAVRCIRAIEDAGIRLRWIEEPVSPDDPAAMAKVRAAVDTPVASGEHEGTRYGFRQLLDVGAIDIMQPDPTRLGGITEARRVWALGESHSLEIIGHLGYASNLHLSLASHASPLVEYFPPHTAGHPDEDEVFRWIFPDEPLPEGGAIPVPTGDGLGVNLDPERVTPILRVSADGVQTVDAHALAGL
jgi:hypothetical protein